MNGSRNAVDEIVKWSDESEKPSKEGADNNGAKGVPDEKFINARFAGTTFFPGDFGMEDVGKNSGGGGGDKGI